MKTKLSILTAILSFSAMAMAQQEGGPAQVCKSIAENAKAKNFEGVQKLTAGMPGHAKAEKKQKKGFDKMAEQYMERLQDLNCGQEVIAKDHAMVEADSKGEKRLIPFIQTEDGWKFDASTYRSFYDTREKSSKAKKKM